jgi:uncharacterized repeat protein (TIGR01451 family)
MSAARRSSTSKRRCASLTALLAGSIFAIGGLLAPSASAAADEFQARASSPAPLTSVTVDPATNVIYAQENNGTAFFSYDPATDVWTALAAAPISSMREIGGQSFNNGGAAYLNGEIYTSYPGEDEHVGVYDIKTNTWSEIANPLGTGTTAITAAGGLIYMVAGTHLISYDPETKTTTTLASAPEWAGTVCNKGFEAWGGLQPYKEESIYGDQGNGCPGFAVYDIATNTWEELPSLPVALGPELGGAVTGSALDPTSGTYYAYGNYGGETLYRYDIEGKSWSTVSFPFTNIDDGGMAYVSLAGQRGVYATYGETSSGFTRYLSTGPPADLSLTKSVDKSSALIGEDITYTIKAANAGPNEAPNAVVNDPLPGNVSLVSVASTVGSCSGTSTVTCNLGSLEKEASATITVVVRADAAGTATNTAAVSSEAFDPTPADESASATTTIPSPPRTTPTTTTTAGAPPPPPPPPPVRPTLLAARWLVPKGILRPSAGWVSDPLLNPNRALTLSGTAQLVSYVAGGKGEPQVLARTTIFLAAGATKALFLHLKPAARAKLARAHQLKVRLQLVLTDQFRRQVRSSGIYLLKAPKARHHKRRPAKK